MKCCNIKYILSIISYVWREVINSSFNHSFVFFSQGHKNKYLLSFSLKTNVRNLLDTTTSPGSMNSLHGMRVAATFFIILAHVYLTESETLTAVNVARWLDVSNLIGNFLYVHLPTRSVWIVTDCNKLFSFSPD